MTDKLHYNKQNLLQDYSKTYLLMMATMVIGVAGALAYFFGLVVYLGGWSHTKPTTFVSTFADRITIEYKGTKLPMYEDPSKADTYLNQTTPQTTPKKAH